ncbi:MAG: SUMF1/EgtB/PvdO family nonheme iron enzyme [Verrucomicrobia bacterium]|nr:SUMF1/EgtB/PvdO family nonheme iron enzyme [Verrucomicrobiota bacterium]
MKQDPVQELIPKATPVAGLTGRLITRKLAWVLGLVALLGLLYYGGGNVRWKNTLSMEFVKVPNTEVMFSIWDTRVSDYRAYADANSGVGQSWKNPSFEQTDDHPVVNVSWVDAQAFCAWLTKKERGEGKIKADQIYRLPTDAEWSVAVGLEGEAGGTPKDKDSKIKGVYPWGTQWPPPKGAGNYNKSLGVDDYDYTSPVGSFAPNKHGLYDMGGNVWQWCEDWYDGAQTSRVLRGASWGIDDPGYLLSSNRGNFNPGSRSNSVGFRCVLVGGGSL